MDQVVEDKDRSGICFQLIMGGGKTSVILSQLIQFISQGTKTPLFLCDHSQFSSVIGNLTTFQDSRFQQEVIRIDYSRDELASKELLEHLLHTLQSAQKEKNCLFMKTSMLQMLQLELISVTIEFKEFLDQSDLSNWEERLKASTYTERLNLLKEINEFFKTHCIALIDEVDINLSVLKGVHFPKGMKQRLKTERIQFVKEIYSLLTNPENGMSDRVGLTKNKQAELTLEKYKTTILPVLAKKLSGSDFFEHLPQAHRDQPTLRPPQIPTLTHKKKEETKETNFFSELPSIKTPQEIAVEYLKEEEPIAPDRKIKEDAFNIEQAELSPQEQSSLLVVEHETARYKEEYADGKAANDTKKCYEIKEEREIAQLIVSIEESSSQYEARCQELEKTIELTVKRLPLEEHSRHLLLTTHASGSLPTPSFIELLRAGILPQEQSEETYRSYNPTLDDHDIATLQLCVKEYLKAYTQMQQLNNARKPLQEFIELGHENQSQKQNLWEKACETLQATPQYTPDEDLLVLFFEYICGFRIRKVQATIVKQVMDQVVEDKDRSGICFQLIMGGGKTSVILSQLIQYLFNNSRLHFSNTETADIFKEKHEQVFIGSILRSCLKCFTCFFP